MKVFRNLTNREIHESLSHVHNIVHVHLAEKEGEEVGKSYVDPIHPTVNRFLDFIPYDEPDRECWIKTGNGQEPVVAVLIEPAGIQVVLDRDQARPV